MNISKINHSNQEYGCGIGKAKLNLYNGKLGFECPLISLGANSFKMESSLVYNSQYKSTDFNGKKIGFCNGWKLNLHQYVFPYLESYDIVGFEEGNYVYIDAHWNIHKFVKYKSSSTYGDSRNAYYDADGTGLKLLVGNNATIQMFDQNNNTFLFDDDGRLIEIISGINVGITKKIVYINGNLTSIYDQRKSTSLIQFMYNLDGTLMKAYTSVNNIGFTFKYSDTKLVKVIKYCSSELKDMMEFTYNATNGMEYIINSTDLTALKFSYISFNGEKAVQKVCFGAMKKTLLTEEVDAELYVSKDIYLGEENFVSGNGKKYKGFLLSMPIEYIKSEEKFSYFNGYTQANDSKGIIINYYFNNSGTLISNLEYKEGELFTLSRERGHNLLSYYDSNTKFDGQNAHKLNSVNNFSYMIDNTLLDNFLDTFRDLNNDDIRDEEFSEHYNISFWLKFKNNNQSNLKATLKYTLSGEPKTSYARLEKTNIDVWQKVIIPLNFGLNQLSLNSMVLSFEECGETTELEIANLKIYKAISPELLIANVVLDIGSILTINGEDKIISPTFYLTESDVFLTYKSLFYSKQNNESNFDLVYNNGTMVKSVFSVGIRNSNHEVCLFSINENGESNYLLKVVDILSNNKYSKTEISNNFKYDINLKKYYYQTKIIAGIIDQSIENDFNEDNSLSIYREQNADGTFRSEKNENNIIVRNYYDSYGNTEKISISKEASEELDSEELLTIFKYKTDIESERENPIYYCKNGITKLLKYDDSNNLITEIIEDCKKTIFKYDLFNENVENVTMGSINDEKLSESNIINYNKNGTIKSIFNSNNIIYGYKYNIYSELEKVYRNKNEFVESTFKKSDNGYVETIRLKGLKNSDIISTRLYDQIGRIIMEKNGEDEVNFYYEDLNGLKSNSLERLIKVYDGYSDSTYNIIYEENDNSSVEVKINNMTVKQYNDGLLTYHLSDDEESYKYINNKNKNNIDTNYYIIDEEKNEKKLEDFTYSYEYDDFGRFIKKNGTISIYNECQECEADGGVNCGQVDGVKLDKKISYHSGTELPKRLSYNIISKSIHTGDDIVDFYYENSNYDNMGNIKNVVECGTRFVQNPKNSNLRDKELLPNRNYTYSYDELNRLTNESNTSFGNLSYKYDSNFGMLSEIKQDDLLLKKFSYNAGYLTNVTYNGIIKQIKYDNYGNILNNFNSKFTYNSRNLMETFSRSDGDTDIINVKCNYYYNYQGIRYKKQKVVDLNGRYPQYTYINYYLNGNTILGEDWKDSNGNVIKRIRYFYDAEGICGIRYDGYNFILVKDSLGNVSKVLYKGKIIGEYLYDAWGNCKVNEISIANERDSFVLHNNPFRYKGYYCDLESNLYYCNTRYYDPSLCIWLSPDSIEYLDVQSINGLNLYCYCKNNPVNYIQRPVSSGGSVISSSISVGGSSVSAGGSSGGGNLGGVGNPTAPWWASTAVGAIPDFILGMRYLAASGMHSKFAYATNTRYMHPIMGGTWRWFGKSSSSFGTVAQGTFKQILTGDARAGFGAIAKSVGGVVGLNALVNFGFNLYENNWQVDSAMLVDTAIDTAIGVGSYYLAAGAMSLATAGLLAAGVALPGIVVVGGVVILSIGFEHLIRAISGYWD